MCVYWAVSKGGVVAVAMPRAKAGVLGFQACKSAILHHGHCLVIMQLAAGVSTSFAGSHVLSARDSMRSGALTELSST